jgi:hypothetical protein
MLYYIPDAAGPQQEASESAIQIMAFEERAGRCPI